jgi:hypothetical protein
MDLLGCLFRFLTRSAARPSSDFRQQVAHSTIPVRERPLVLFGSTRKSRIGLPQSKQGGRFAWDAPASRSRSL